MNIDQLVKDFKTMEEMKIFCQSQFKQIISLNNKIRDLEEKLKNNNTTSKEINNLPEKSSSNLPANSNATFLVEDDAKTISQVQLKLIKEQAFERELTLEEAKRVEIYNKILTSEGKSDKDKPIKANAKVLDDKDLLALIVNNG